MNDDIYKAIIIEYYKHPRNKGTLEKPDASHRESNPLCGDEIQMDLRIENNKIKEAVFDGQGCALSTASASMLTEFLVGKSLGEIKKLSKEDVLDLVGIQPGPTRIKCVLLPFKVLKVAAYDYLAEKMPDVE